MDTEVTREQIHHRRIDMRGYRRNDGLFDIEAHLTDRKPHDFSPGGFAQHVPANQAIHDMGVRLTIDEHLVIHAVSTFMDATPHLSCRGGGDALQTIVGLRIGSGWAKEVRTRLGGAHSCTHLMELLIPMATTAFQALSDVRRAGNPDATDADGRPRKIDTCYAYGATREIVRQRWPGFYRPPAK